MARLTQYEEEELMHAIAAAEAGSIGELRVVILRKVKGDALAAAKRHFGELGLAETCGRSGVLLLVSTHDHKAAIIGDVGVHDKVGERFWQAVIDRAIAFFRNGELLLGLLSAVDEIGQAFRAHLPAERGEGNELPNAVHYD